ncbi:MAG: shikimate dehydrogenase [Candidatus Bathyarchaeota archaeon]|nr:shikimate dehydrogenase [Candidatus Bathyarchaeota archaeon]
MKLIFLIGYPVSHSMSAVMQNAAFSHHYLPYEYQLRSVKPEELRDFVAEELRSENIRGANVTIPHKVTVMSLLDEFDASAKAIGAVNTIVNDAGRLKGYNTDGTAALRAVTEAYGSIEEANIVILGAGGAAHAVGYQLSRSAKQLTIFNRNSDNAEKLASRLQQGTSTKVSTVNLSQLKRAIESADILINATPIGMVPYIDESPIESSILHPNLLVFDLVYNPERTRLIREAEIIGSRSLSGVKMLVYQGSEAFRLWTGVESPEALMMTTIKARLGAKG